MEKASSLTTLRAGNCLPYSNVQSIQYIQHRTNSDHFGSLENFHRYIADSVRKSEIGSLGVISKLQSGKLPEYYEMLKHVGFIVSFIFISVSCSALFPHQCHQNHCVEHLLLSNPICELLPNDLASFRM